MYGLLLAAASCRPVDAAVPCGVPPVREEMTLQSDGATLRAVFTRPDGPGRYPAAVLVHGSGRQTAENVGWMTSRLLDMGVAVLAYDKRGVGQSTGEYSGVGASNSDVMFRVLAADAFTAIQALEARSDVNSAQLGLVGNSQGGWIAPLAASRSRDVKFVLSISGPVTTVGEENEYSRLAGADPGSLQGLSDAEISSRFAAFAGPHGFDPVPILQALDTPSLWIIGELDRSIPVRKTLDNLERLARDHQRPVTTHIVPRADHSLRDRISGEPINYWSSIQSWLRTRITLRPCTR